MPLVPTKEQNDDIQAHRMMVRVETIMNWFLHALNAKDDETYDQSILVTLQLLTDMWTSLSRTRINKLLQIKGDSKRLHLTETRYEDDPTYKTMKQNKTVRQRQIQQHQRGRGRGGSQSSFNRQSENSYKPSNNFRGGRGGRGRGGRGGSAPSTPRNSNTNS